jgi:hypothetical protein
MEGAPLAGRGSDGAASSTERCAGVLSACVGGSDRSWVHQQPRQEWQQQRMQQPVGAVGYVSMWGDLQGTAAVAQAALLLCCSAD